MSKGKMFKFGHKGAISFWISDAWYEVVDGTKCFHHASITHRIKEGFCLISVVFLIFKITLFVKLRDHSNG